MDLKLIAFGLLLALLGHSEAATFKFTNVACESLNESLIIISECRLRAISRNKTTYSFVSTLRHPVNAVRIEAQFFKRANGYKPWLIKGNIDGCRFLKKAYSPVSILVYKLIRDFSNINHPCPYVGELYIRNMYIQMERMPHTLPTGDYLITLNWVLNRKLTVLAKVYISFVEDIIDQ